MDTQQPHSFDLQAGISVFYQDSACSADLVPPRGVCFMDSNQKAARDETEQQSDTAPAAAPPVNLPLGTHTINVPSHVAAYIQSLAGEKIPALDGTRVWMRRKKDAFVLHLGDVELGTLED
jgi:hypothetical protein